MHGQAAFVWLLVFSPEPHSPSPYPQPRGMPQRALLLWFWLGSPPLYSIYFLEFSNSFVAPILSDPNLKPINPLEISFVEVHCCSFNSSNSN